MKKSITINRQFGSSGRTIGKPVAEYWGVSCYESEIYLETELSIPSRH